MPDFTKLWNSTLNKDDLPDVVASVTVDALNNVLSVHRNKKGDREFYRREEKFSDAAGKVLFDAEVIVGGDRNAHSGGTAKPLRLDLQQVPITSANTGFAYAYESRVAGAAPDKPNAIITATDVNFYFSWPSTTSGTPWNTQLAGIEFVMEVFLQLKEVAGPDGKVQQVVEIIPIRLRVSKAAVDRIRGHLGRVVAHQPRRTGTKPVAPGDDQKVQDLFFALINYIALSVGPKLAKVIVIPLMEINDYEVLPTLFSLTPQALTIGARLNLSEQADRVERAISGLQERFWDEVDADLYDQSKGQPLRVGNYDFPRATAFIDAYRNSINASRTRRMPVPPKGKARSFTAPDQQVAVGLNEFLLNAVVSRFGNIHRQGRTGWVSLLAVRGRLGYELGIGAILINVDASGITGSTPVNVFGGLYYQWKEVDGCSVHWGDEHKLGLGIKGTPAIKLKTVPSSGLSVLANFELGNLSFYTGAGPPIDDILKALSGPLMKLIEAVLDTIALGISFVVIPAKFAIPHQATEIAFSRFVTSQYKHPNGGTSSRNNFAMFVANTAAG